MLDGGEGVVKQKAMELIVRYGNVLEAERLCQVTWADLFCGAHGYLDVVRSDQFNDIFSRMSLCSKESVKLDQMATTCVCFSGIEPDCTEVPDQMLMNPTQQSKNTDHLNRYVDSGVVLSGNCIPYFTGFIPLFGDHFVSCESSAVLFMNTLWGARANGDGIEASFCAAVCGRTPYWGKHISENRGGTDLVTITTNPATVHDWDIFGHAIGEKLPPFSIPVIQGFKTRPSSIQLKSFFGTLACAAGTEMCHIIGVTPEAMTVDQAFSGKMTHEQIEITADDITASKAKLNQFGREKIDYISLGCPHYHIDELRIIADYLEEKRIHPDTIVHLWTAGTFKYMADRCGYTEVIEKSGAKLLTGSCPSTRGYPKGVQTAAYDSAKQRMSAAQETKARLFYGSLTECLESAISGYWEGKI
jgi:predicted aconitase